MNCVISFLFSFLSPTLLAFLVSFLFSFSLSSTGAEAAARKSTQFAKASCLAKDGEGACYTVDSSLNELSGIVAHSHAKDIFWVMNDQGKARVYAINLRGEIVTTLELNAMDFDDTEDLSVGPGPKPGKPYIYVGDIGKARKKVGTVKIFRFEEPDEKALENARVAVRDVQLIRLSYSKTTERDFETQLIDPISGDLFLIEKDGFKVFKAKHEEIMASPEVLTGRLIVMEEVRDSKSWDSYLSGGAVSPSGDEILLRNDRKAWLFRRSPGQSLDAALAKPVQVITLSKEFNGEAISFDNNGLDFYTVSENFKSSKDYESEPQPISIYKRLK